VKLPTLPTLLHQERQRNLAFEKAKELSNGKGIINLGAGIHRSIFAHSTAHSPEVVLNVDVKPDGVSNYIQLDLEQTPYPFEDKQFSVCFASHILEHLENWQAALDEMKRISDWVIIVLPHPFDIFAVLNPNHKQHFTKKTIDSIKDSNVVIYY